MSAADLFHYSVAIAVWVGMAIFAYTAWKLLGIAKNIQQGVNNLLEKLATVPEALKFNILSLLSSLMKSKRG